MRRRTLNLLTGASLLLCAAVVVLWVMSYTAAADARRLRLHVAARGGLYLHTIDLRAGALEYTFYRRTAPPPARGAYAGARHASLPLGVPGVILLGVIFLLVRRHRKLRLRSRMGVCHSCGYDLRATPGRCPECGAGAVDVPSESDAPAGPPGAGAV